jgi:hypothetical protein
MLCSSGYPGYHCPFQTLFRSTRYLPARSQQYHNNICNPYICNWRVIERRENVLLRVTLPPRRGKLKRRKKEGKKKKKKKKKKATICSRVVTKKKWRKKKRPRGRSAALQSGNQRKDGKKEFSPHRVPNTMDCLRHRLTSSTPPRGLDVIPIRGDGCGHSKIT